MRRQPTPYRKRANLANYCKALVELDRAEAEAERQRIHVFGLTFKADPEEVRRAMMVVHLALFRTHYARQNVAHYGRKVRG